jgi:rare lipoprotein A
MKPGQASLLHARWHMFILGPMMIGLASCAAPVMPVAPAPAVFPPPLMAVPPAPPEPPQAAETAPPASPFFSQEGVASFYGKAHQGKRTANGERFDQMDLTAAHPSLRFGTVVRVTNLRNGRVVKVRINDRGPHVKGRVIDVSTAAARALGVWSGLMRVRVEAFAADQ